MNLVDELHAGLDRDPTDQVLRMALADALDESGDPELVILADGYRALAAWERVPFHRHSDRKWRWGMNNDDRWLAYIRQQRGEVVKRVGNLRGLLSREIYTQSNFSLPHSWEKMMGYEWDTRRQAEDAAALAFTKLPESAREFYLTPVRTPA